MPTPINAELYVQAFNSTAIPGQYEFTDASFNNQSDTTGSGALDVVVGMILYVQASSVATAMAIPGVFHRYKLTSVTATDSTTLSGVMEWDEGGVEEDSPTNSSYCLLAEATLNNKLGLLPADAMYPSIPPGSTDAAERIDTKAILDKLGGAGRPDSEVFTFTNAEDWVVVHGRNTKSFVTVLRDELGDKFYAGEHVIDGNSFVIHCSAPSSGTVLVQFM